MMIPMSKRLLVLLMPLILAGMDKVEAQQPTKIPRIGYLGAVPSSAWHEAFRQGLRDLGYVEGKNIVIEWRWAGEKIEQYPAIAAELVSLKVDIIVATG